MATTSAAMAAMRLLQVTLSLLLLVLAAQAKEGSTDVLFVLGGVARCKHNCSRIIDNAPLHLLIDNATIAGTGRTTSTGEIVMTVRLTSGEQVASLLMSSSNGSSKAFLIAPPHVCGAPVLPNGTVVAAPVRPVAAISASGQLLLPINGSLHAAMSIGLNAQIPTIASSIKMMVAHTIEGFACTLLTGIVGGIV